MRVRFAAAAAVSLVVAAVVSAQTTYLLNGSFTQCVEPCTEFGSPTEWVPEGNPFPVTIGIWRDMVDYNTAPASLAVMAMDTASANFNQAYKNTSRLPASPGASYTVEADVRIDSTSGGSFQLASHYSCGTYWTECGAWQTHYMGNSVTSGWQHVSNTATLPSNVVWGLFRVHIRGPITFHVDNVKINGQEEVVEVVYDKAVPMTDRKTPLLRQGTLALGRETAYGLEVLTPDGRAVLKAKGYGSTVNLAEKGLAEGFYVVRVSAPGMAVRTANVMVGK